MRQIYTSPRLENIDRMVALLGEHGIETRTTDRPIYMRSSYNRPSFRETDRQAWPKVWVANGADVPRARELLRSMGIDVAGETKAVPQLAFSDPSQAREQRMIGRVRALLLVTIFGLMLVMVLRGLGWL